MRWAIGIVVLVVIIVLALAQRLASFYTDLLWFRSVDLSSVWTKTITVEAGLGATFCVIFFGLLWGNLWLSDRLAPSAVLASPGDELVAPVATARSQPHEVDPLGRGHPVRTDRRAQCSCAMEQLAALFQCRLVHDGLGTMEERPRPAQPPERRLLCLQAALPRLGRRLGVLSPSGDAAAVRGRHYLNGGIRPGSPVQRVSPRVKAHLSVLLASWRWSKGQLLPTTPFVGAVD